VSRPTAADIIAYAHEHPNGGVAVVVLITPEGRTLDEFIGLIAEPLLALGNFQIPSTLALVAREPVQGVTGVPVVHLDLFPDLETLTAEKSGSEDVRRGYH